MPSIADIVAQIQAGGLPVPVRRHLHPPGRDPCPAPTCPTAWVCRGRIGIAPAPHDPSRPLHFGRCLVRPARMAHSLWLSKPTTSAPILPRSMTRPRRLHQFCGLVGIAPPFPNPGYRLLSLAERLHDLSRQLLDGALCLDPDQDCIIRAHGRASNYMPPSLKGGEVKDATIVEECLEVSRRLQVVGFSPKRVFCTSNTRDYCERGSSSRIHRWPSISARPPSGSRRTCPGR